MLPRILLALVIAVTMNASIVASDSGKPWCCYSIRESKLRGCFVCTVTITPNIIQSNGKLVAIKEAWIEKQLEYGLFNTKLKAGRGYTLCITTQRSDLSCSFSMEGRGHGFMHLGTVVAHDQIDKIDNAGYSVLLTVDKEMPVKLRATPVR